MGLELSKLLFFIGKISNNNINNSELSKLPQQLHRYTNTNPNISMIGNRQTKIYTTQSNNKHLHKENNNNKLKGYHTLIFPGSKKFSLTKRGKIANHTGISNTDHTVTSCT